FLQRNANTFLINTSLTYYFCPSSNMTTNIDQLLKRLSNVLEASQVRLANIFDQCSCPHMSAFKNAVFGEVFSFYGMVISDLEKVTPEANTNSSSLTLLKPISVLNCVNNNTST